MQSTTAAPNPTGKNPVVLGRYLDALVVGVHGVAQPVVLERMASAKASLLESGASGRKVGTSAPKGIPGGRFVLRPWSAKKGRYAYVLENASMILELSDREKLPATMPRLTVKFKAVSLYEYDLDALELIVDRVASFLLEDGFRVKVSRADLALDFQASDAWTLPAVEDVVCRASKRRYEYENTTAKSATFGTYKQPLQAQIYTKSEEILTSGKEWMREVWNASGVFDSDRPVYRCELRFQRRYLRELVRPGGCRNGIETIADLRDATGDLVYSVLGDGDGAGSWLRFADPATRGKKADRRCSAGWWSGLRSAFQKHTASTGRVRVAGGPDTGSQKVASLEDTVQRLGRGMVKVAAMAKRLGLHTGDDMERLYSFVRFRHMEQLRHEGVAVAGDTRPAALWAGAVAEALARLEGVAIDSGGGFVGNVGGFTPTDLKPARAISADRFSPTSAVA